MEKGQDSRIMIVHTNPEPVKSKTFGNMAFGPWTTHDPMVQRTIVRTNASGGITQKKFKGTYPPPPTIAVTRTVITNGFEFSINVVTGGNVAGYNVYSSTTNNGNVAKLLRFVSQPTTIAPNQSIKVQDITAASPFYWVSSINNAGKESTRVPVAGTAAPSPSSTTKVTVGGSSGFGSGGGKGGASFFSGRKTF